MTVNIVVPEMGESVHEARVARWLKAEGDAVAAGEVLVELETEKVNFEVGAERAGILSQIARKEGDDVRGGDVLGVVDEASQPRASAGPAPSPGPGTGEVKGDRTIGPSTVTPLARRIAEDHRLDITDVAASIPGGRVTKQDVERYLARREAAPVRGEPHDVGSGRREERMRMSLRRLTIARRLLEAQQTAAMLTTFNEIDMQALMALRARHKEAFQQRHGVGLGIVSSFVKATIAALREFPRVNAELQGEELVLKHYFDIGVAVGAKDGLVVPVLREADRMSIAEIEMAIRTYVQKAGAGTLSLDDLRGGTFTITNGGVFGSLLSTPILNPPQAGILGLHRIADRPVARDGQVVIRPMMYVALTYDHRIVDGREAVQFLARIKDLIESPETLLLET
jgi:2-oxoglutarate dehydrogenase E2 component (dihydrolipoamide succinyltransferase)